MPSGAHRTCVPRASQPGGRQFLDGRAHNQPTNRREENMHRLTVSAVALCATAMFSTGAFAQVPPDPNNPNENVPNAVPFSMPYGAPIDLLTAKKVAAAAETEVGTRKWGSAFCITIVDPSGNLVYFERGDNCQQASVSISQHKARTAAEYRRPTLVFERLVAKGNYFSYLRTLDDVIASRGGNPLVVDGNIVGAIGVSGGTGSQDDVVSQAGVASLQTTTGMK
jgi:glc operon protein GlcG